MLKRLMCAAQIVALLIGAAESTCNEYSGDEMQFRQKTNLSDDTVVEFKFNMTQVPEGETFRFYVLLENVDRDHMLDFFLTLDELCAYNDYGIESKRFLAFIPRQGPVHSLKFSTYGDMYRVYINGVKAFKFVDNALLWQNRIMTHALYDGVQYVNQIIACVYDEPNKEI